MADWGSVLSYLAEWWLVSSYPSKKKNRHCQIGDKGGEQRDLFWVTQRNPHRAGWLQQGQSTGRLEWGMVVGHSRHIEEQKNCLLTPRLNVWPGKSRH